MSTATHTPSTRTAATRRPTRDPSVKAALTLLVVAMLGAAVALAVAIGREPAAPQPAGVSLAPTGDVNAMGMPVVGTPGAAGGSAVAGGVEVEGANWDLGTVPLNVAVRPTWTLRNSGPETVSLGEPRPEVRDGCCPGPITLSERTLEPGETTRLTFELSMHPGMDGWHDLAVHVPVTSATGADNLVLGVVGDFRD